MKKLIIIFMVLISMSLKTNAQIPNNGFEIWENYPDPDNVSNVYERPSQWIGLLPDNPSTYSFSIEKNLDSYPSSTGQYSIVVKSDVANGVMGVALTCNDTLTFPFSPAFPVTSQQTKLCGYYKFFPQNNDTAVVQIIFYLNGQQTNYSNYLIYTETPSWTPFLFDINPASADSATIALMSFYGNGPEDQPNGNSRLYIDNLSFNNLITSVNEDMSIDLPKSFALMQNYPNPFNPTTTINYSIPKTSFVTIKVYTVLGNEVATLLNEKKSPGNYKIEFSANNLSSGIYFYHMQSCSFTDTKKLILLK